jgi:three-Cys-motif partner protein
VAKKNDDFFKEKKPWSVIKDDLLSNYLTPYVTKILTTYKPLVYVDCFAGKGKFENGEKGSPLIALKILDNCKKITTVPSPKITAYFIDLNYGTDLKDNLPNSPDIQIISGAYEDNIEDILMDKKNRNVFLYIDPYGLKALQYSLLKKFSDSNFYTIEVLINFNSFGFIREACHAFAIDYVDVTSEFFEDLVEYEPTTMDASKKSVDDLCEIAGGDYWIEIIENYKSKQYDGYQAETLFAEQYCKKLKENYTYVLNMPLRIGKDKRPKYRMIHATNHADGCVLMGENIYGRLQSMFMLQSHGQKELWDQDSDNNIISHEKIEKCLKEHIINYKENTPINKFYAEFYCKYGPFYSLESMNELIKKFEKEQKIVIERDPAITQKGNKSTFLVYNKTQKALIRRLI